MTEFGVFSLLNVMILHFLHVNQNTQAPQSHLLSFITFVFSRSQKHEPIQQLLIFWWALLKICWALASLAENCFMLFKLIEPQRAAAVARAGAQLMSASFSSAQCSVKLENHDSAALTRHSDYLFGPFSVLFYFGGRGVVLFSMNCYPPFDFVRRQCHT